MKNILQSCQTPFKFVANIDKSYAKPPVSTTPVQSILYLLKLFSNKSKLRALEEHDTPAANDAIKNLQQRTKGQRSVAADQNGRLHLVTNRPHLAVCFVPISLEN